VQFTDKMESTRDQALIRVPREDHIIDEETDDEGDFEKTDTNKNKLVSKIAEDILENNNDVNRYDKSLIGTFPFPFVDQNLDVNSQHQSHHENELHRVGHHELEHHHEHQHGQFGHGHGLYDNFLNQESNRVNKRKFELLYNISQNGGTEEVKDGRRCINKVMLVEETEFDEVLTCDHSYDNRCHTSYVTKYEPHQEEDCEEKFKKTCYIDYEQKAYAETVQVCITPWVKDCSENVEAPQFCQTVYQSECFTKQTVHEVEDDVAVCNTVEEQKCQNVTSGYTTELKCDKWPREVCSLTKQKVKKYTPDTSCEKVPKEMCRPRGCGIKEGPVQCRDKVKTVIVDNPVEECDMEPIRTCKHVTKLVPRLVASQECVEVPKEICARSKINPRRVQKPAVQKWCYTIEDYSSTTEPPVLESACQDDTSCAPGYICEQGECKARPGKVLLNSITIRTEDCKECKEEGVILTLYGERVIGLPEGVPCTTELLDHTDTRDFQKGQTAVWDESSPTQLGGCYEAPLNAMLRDGGKLEWKGTGTWTPQSVCVDWKSTNSVYQCLVVPVPSSNSTDTEEDAPITTWSLMNCEDLFPKQSCSEEEK